MKATQELHNLGQSLWLDNITRDLLDNGTLKRYIDEFSITGLTSNPTIFEHAISKSKSYDAEIGRLLSTGLSGEELFFELALQDLTRAADLFGPVHERTAGNCPPFVRELGRKGPQRESGPAGRVQRTTPLLKGLVDKKTYDLRVIGFAL